MTVFAIVAQSLSVGQLLQLPPSAHGTRTLPPMRSAEPEQVETLMLSEVVVKSHVGGLVKLFE